MVMPGDNTEMEVKLIASIAMEDGLRFAIIGMPVSLISMVVVSLMTQEPDAETQAMVDDIRDPFGKAYLAEDH